MRLVAFARALARAQTAHPWRFLGVAIVLTLLAGLSASTLRFDSQYEALLPQDSLQIRTATEIREKTGGTRQIVVAIKGENNETRRAFGEKLVPLLREIDGIRSADLDFPGQFLRDRALWLLDREILEEVVDNAERTAKIYHENEDPRILKALAFRLRDLLEEQQGRLPETDELVSRDGQYTFLALIPSVSLSDLPESHRLMGDIRQVVDDLHPESAGLTVEYAGTMEVYVENHAKIQADLRNSSLLALFLGMAVVAIFTRRLSAPLLIGAVLATGIVATYGIARAFVERVNMVTGFLGAVLLGLGIAFGVHLLMRYLHELARNGGDVEAAIESGVVHTLRPTLSSAFTTAGTFLSFVIAVFPPFFEFGMIAALGVTMTLLATFALLPPLLVVTNSKRARRRLTQVKHSSPWEQRLRVASLPKSLAIGLVVVFVAFAAFGTLNVANIPFINDFRALRGNSPATDFTDYVSDNIGIGLNPAVAIVDSIDDARASIQIIRRDAEEHSGEPPYVSHALTISDLLPPADIERRRELLERLRAVLEDQAIQQAIGEAGEQGEAIATTIRSMLDAQPWTIEELPDYFRQRFITVDGQQYIMFIWPSEPVESDVLANRWEDRLRSFERQIEERGVDTTIADEVLIRGWTSRLVLTDAPRVIPLAAVIVLFILLIDYRSIFRTLLVGSSLAVGMLTFIAVMHLMGMTLNMFNIVVIPSVIGIGIDASVHMYHRYVSEGRGSLVYVMRYTGAAVFLASLTTAIGFGSSLISSKPGLQSMGSAAVAGIGMTFLAAVFFFPAALSLIEASRKDWPKAKQPSEKKD